MQIGTVTTGSVATAVWTQAARVITGLGTAIALLSTANTSLAAGASVDLRPGANKTNDTIVGVKTGAAATGATTINIWDGTTAIVIATTAAAALSAAGTVVKSNSTSGGRITNTDGAVAATYQVAGWQWSA